jgi:hypothetical protein
MKHMAEIPKYEIFALYKATKASSESTKIAKSG